MRLANPANNDLSDDAPITNWGYFILFSYLYLLQGVISGIISTMPYIYPILPGYNSMALFNANLLPFSFKFIIGTHFFMQLLSYKNTVSCLMVRGKLGW